VIINVKMGDCAGALFLGRIAPMDQKSRTANIALSAAVAAFAVTGCALLAAGFAAFGIDVPYLCFIIAIVACCALGGWPLAAWALVFSAVGLWDFFLPPTGLGWPKYSDTAHLIVFVIVAFFVCWIIDGLRRANDALWRDNVVLGVKLSALLKRAKAL
jgi:K+-sensing histidine kinase KdpD